MNPTTPNSPNPSNMVGFHSLNSPLFISDEPGDNTVRPASPEDLKRFEAERERLRKYGLNMDGTPITPPPEDGAK